MYGKGWEPQSNGENHRTENHWGQRWASVWAVVHCWTLPMCSMCTVVWAPAKDTYCFYTLTDHPEQSVVICVETFTALIVCFSSVQFSPSVVSDSTIPWTAAHQASLSISTSGVYSNSCPLSRWCHPTISSSVMPFSSCLQSFPASGSFPRTQFFASRGQSIEASASVLPMNIQDWFALGLTGLISLQSKGLS